jgi:hypothetical protein
MPSSKPLVAFLLVASLTGCLGVDAFLSPTPAVTVENRSDVTYELTVTVVHTDDPVSTLLVERTYRDGRDSAVPFGDHAVGNYLTLSPNVTDVRVVGSEQSTWTTTLDPSESAEAPLTDWQSGDAVLLTWTRTTDGTVAKVTAVSCRNAGFEYSAHVDTRGGSGGGSTSC